MAKRGKGRTGDIVPTKTLLEQMTDVFSLPAVQKHGKSDDELKGKPVKCFLCGLRLDIRLTKKERPYWICDVCGVQVFVRGDEGIRRLKKLMRDDS